MNVKICGIMDVETALFAARMGADALGFVFAPSRRRVTPELAKEIIQQLPDLVAKVGVFVDESVEVIEEIASFCGLTIIQLHGEESMDMCNQLSLPVIKAVGIANEEDVKKALRYPTSYLLVDSPKGQMYHGGNGETFDWHVLNEIDYLNKKLILAGGLKPENVKIAIQTVRPYMVDVSSGVETDGKKDFDKISQFILAAKGEEME
ncbi:MULTISPECIES: phosphoribosylanthranilate isomerase [Bacillus]|uniref:phosphoribosylanthranilate isomerase n=1 Tax=Bacillus TaxID=1386 RepID=UPI0002FC34FC|nr:MULTISPECIES: phosphoribosylanthranilate isomerase [Bacillus]